MLPCCNGWLRLSFWYPAVSCLLAVAFPRQESYGTIRRGLSLAYVSFAISSATVRAVYGSVQASRQAQSRPSHLSWHSAVSSAKISMTGGAMELTSATNNPLLDDSPWSVPQLLLDLGSLHTKSQVLNSLSKLCESHNISHHEFGSVHFSFDSVVKRIINTTRLAIDDVYNSIDFSCLMQQPPTNQSSGYSPLQKDQAVLRTILASCTARLHPLSNAPSSTLCKLIQCMGLAHIKWESLRSTTTHSSSDALLSSESLRSGESAAIAVTPRETFIVYAAKSREHRFVLHDVDVQSLCLALNWTDPNFTFCDVSYLQAKNAKDLESLSPEVWRELLSQLKTSSMKHKLSSICIVELGAGVLLMLETFMKGHGCLPALDLPGVSFVQYFAYEPNHKLEPACRDRLQRLGFELTRAHRWSRNGSELTELVFRRYYDRVNWTVHLRFWGFDEYETRWQPPPNAIVGCCFADLMPPEDLAATAFRRFLTKSADFSDTFMYFPITFAGTTQFLPPKPFEEQAIPSDTKAFQVYARCLERLFKHNLEPNLLVEALRCYGATFLLSRSSDWLVHPQGDNYLWESLMHFFGTVPGPALQHEGWDARLWLQRARRSKPSIHVSNVDLLFQIPRLGEWKVDAPDKLATERSIRTSHCRELLFTAPGVVAAVGKPMAELQPHEVRVQAELSLISSGTELKVFQGNFDGAQLDANIKGLCEQQMSYPLAYGYSLVGRVVECGSQVPENMLGQVVFCFSPHSTHAVVNHNVVHVVPKGVDAADAIFLPSVETALSLVHDAHPRVGEKVVVFGQGLIGILTTGILRLTARDSTSCGTITTVDPISRRLAASSQFGSSEALLPDGIPIDARFDVAIEVSGNGKALQQAIDVTRDGGTIVVGSWYGDRNVSLKLGTDFHRSHKLIKASQVSEIPAELRFRWSKARRFAVAWDLVRALQPSRLLPRMVSLDQAQEAYEALQRGDEIAVAFEYAR